MVYIKLNFDFCFFMSFLKRLLLIKYSLVHYSTAEVTIKRPPRDLAINVRKMKTSYTSELYTTSFLIIERNVQACTGACIESIHHPSIALWSSVIVVQPWKEPSKKGTWERADRLEIRSDALWKKRSGPVTTVHFNESDESISRHDSIPVSPMHWR